MSVYERMILRIAHIEESTNLLGPFNRFVIWVHGCCFNCEGCLATNTKDGAYDCVTVDELAKRIINSSCEGVTISGGEPFLQAESLLYLLKKVREQRDLGVIVYSGFTLDELSGDAEKSVLLPEIDVLIDGRYIKELDDGRAYIGSSNQVIHYITPRYINAGKMYYAATKRQAEIKFTSTQAVLIGVPSESVLRVWQSIKKKSGGRNYDF